MLTRLTVTAALALACGVQPPDSVTIDHKFTDEQRAQIVDGIDQWCASVGFCPKVLPAGGEAMIWADTQAQYRERGRDPRSDAFSEFDYVTGDFDVFINVDHEYHQAMSGLWQTAAHEIGHFGAGHASTGLMAQGEDGPLCIDQAAVDVWCADQLCPVGARGTCE